MKLFVYDEKHEQIHGALELQDTDKEIVDKVVEFLNGHGFTNRYHRLVVAKSYTQTYEDGESTIEFEY